MCFETKQKRLAYTVAKKSGSLIQQKFYIAGTFYEDSEK